MSGSLMMTGNQDVSDDCATHQTLEQTPKRPETHRPKPETPFGDLIRFLYSNNPFYVVSAGLVFFGLRVSFDTSGDTFQSNALMFGLVGYVALLAGSACFLVRVGKVWDDVRSLLILIVLMCLAISVCFDDALASNPSSGIWYYVAGFLFTAVVSESVLFGMPLRLPAVFRIPYYLIVALFFFYPVLLSPLIPHPDDPRLHWGLFAFSSAAGLAFLTLLPAARRGPHAIAENAAPWPWPWYPWILFGVLALGVLGRAYYLCISLHFVVGDDSIFETYFWVPFLLVLNVLLLELLASVRRSGRVAVPGWHTRRATRHFRPRPRRVAGPFGICRHFHQCHRRHTAVLHGRGHRRLLRLTVSCAGSPTQSTFCPAGSSSSASSANPRTAQPR